MGDINRENYERFGEGVIIALGEAGWLPGRSVDVTKWVQQLEPVGYLVSPYVRQVWAEFGNLNIRSLPSRVPKSSLRVDPVDAGIDTFDEAQRLAVRLQATFAPLGMWSSQFRAYVGDRGRVVAVGPRSAWFLGDTIEGALRFVVEGDGRGITRPDIEEWILLINTYKAIGAMGDAAMSIIRPSDPDFRICLVDFNAPLELQSNAEGLGFPTRWTSADALHGQVKERDAVLQTLMREKDMELSGHTGACSFSRL